MLLLQLMKLAPSIVFTDCYFFILFQQCKPRLHFRCQCNTGHRGQCSNALVDSVDRQLGLCLFCAIGSECNCECCNCYSFPPGTSCLDASRANHQWHDQCIMFTSLVWVAAPAQAQWDLDEPVLCILLHGPTLVLPMCDQWWQSLAMVTNGANGAWNLHRSSSWSSAWTLGCSLSTRSTLE